MATMDRLGSDRRQYVRVSLSANVTFYHLPSQRSFPARSVDVSEGGMLLYVPAATPVAEGQQVELTVERKQSPTASSPSAGPTGMGAEPTVEVAGFYAGRIVRVDRPRMLKTGHLPVAVRFTKD